MSPDTGIIQPGCATISGFGGGEEKFLLLSWVGAVITNPKKYVGAFCLTKTVYSVLWTPLAAAEVIESSEDDSFFSRTSTRFSAWTTAYC